MADILDDGFGQQAPIDLDSFVDTSQQSTSVAPLAATRNKAATTALLTGDPQEAVDRYKTIMNEMSQGYSPTQKFIQQEIDVQVDQLNQQQILGILADPNIGFNTKKGIIENFGKTKQLKDNTQTLQANLLSAGSKGEDFDQEAARLTTADAMDEMYQARTKIQGLVNAHIASLQNKDFGSAFMDVMASGNSYIGGTFNAVSKANIARAQAIKDGKSFSWLDYLGALANAGGTTRDLHDAVFNLPPEKWVEASKSLIDTIASDSAIIFGNDNQANQFDAFDKIFNEGGYTSKDQFMDTVGPYLDLLGAYSALKPAKKLPPSTYQPGKNYTQGGPTAGRGTGYQRKAAEPVEKAEWELVDDEPKNPFPGNQLPNNQPKLTYDQPTKDDVKRIVNNAPVHRSNPSSPMEAANQANPDTARNLFASVYHSQSDEVAEAVAGVDRNQALANNTYPQAIIEDGRVTTKPFDIERQLRQEDVDPAFVNLARDSTGVGLTEGERAELLAQTARRFEAANGVTMNTNMSSFSSEAGQVKASAVYGSNDGSWSRAEDAVEQTKFALRSFGIRDDEITVLQKQGLDHVPVKLEDVKGVDGDYLVRVNSDVDMNPFQRGEADDDFVFNFEKLVTKYNWADRIPSAVDLKHGTVTRHLFDVPMVIDPKLAGPASLASDFAARAEKTMLEFASKFSDRWVKLNKKERALVDEYIIEANQHGIPFDQADLISRGMGAAQIDAVKAWRDFWDGHFYLENYDLVKSLRAQNYQLFDNGMDRLVARPVAKAYKNNTVYDPASQSVRILTVQEMDDLYNTGGTIAKLRSSTIFHTNQVDYMMVPNTASAHLKGIRDSDNILNYREGYYQIQYKAPKFIEEVQYDAKGVETSRRAVAVAGDTREAQFFADRMQRTTGVKHEVREDNKMFTTESDEYWNINQASGRIAQRHRGKLLESAGAPNQLGDGRYVVPPVDSAVKAAKSIAGRTMNRDMLENAKARIIAQFPDAFPKNEYGQAVWPSNRNMVGKKGAQLTEYSADARTNWEYITSLENGYINAIDAGWKAFLYAGANTVGEVSTKIGKAGAALSPVERGLYAAGSVKPGSVAKGAVYQAYIGTNFARNLIVQPHQAIRTWAYNPQAWLSGNGTKLMAEFVNNVFGGPETDFTKFIKRWGGLDGVDKNNLVRGTLLQASDISVTNKVGRALNAPIRATQMVGFDLGERANLLGHAVAVFDRYKRMGANVADVSVMDKMAIETRALSGGLNSAADFPYTQNSFSMALQFLQVPHKLGLQLFNRQLPFDKRLALTAFDLAMWGIPTGMVSYLLGGNILPDKPEYRNMLEKGIEEVMYNHFYSELTGEKVDVDYSSLATYNVDGFANLFHNILTKGFMDTVANTPTGQLFLKDGGRVQNAIGAMSRFMKGYFDPTTPPETALSVINEAMKITSLYSNIDKARLMLKTGKVLDQYGNTIDDSSSKMEAWAQALGFPTNDARRFYEFNKANNQMTKARKDEIENGVKELFRYAKTHLQEDNQKPEFALAVISYAAQAWSDNPQDQQIARSAIAKMMASEDANTMRNFLRAIGIKGSNMTEDMIKSSNMTEEEKQQATSLLQDARASRGRLEEMKRQQQIKEVK